MNLKTRLEERDGQTVFVINRKEWARGVAGGELWVPAAQWGCCLGLAALVEDVPVEAIRYLTSPDEIQPTLRPKSYSDAWVQNGAPSENAEVAIGVNDAEDVSEDQREAEIADVFVRARGWLVEFED